MRVRSAIFVAFSIALGSTAADALTIKLRRYVTISFSSGTTTPPAGTQADLREHLKGGATACSSDRLEYIALEEVVRVPLKGAATTPRTAELRKMLLELDVPTGRIFEGTGLVTDDPLDYEQRGKPRQIDTVEVEIVCPPPAP